MLIKHIIKLDTQGKFIPAVQISDYDDPLDNMALVKSYIFSKHAPDIHGGESRVVGSIDLLREIRLAYTNSSFNRFSIVANFGHGKSHLAVVLANYFGKPHQSTEVSELLKRIDAPLQNNLPEAENFHEFKRQCDQFLVVRLRGDTPRTLREQFFPALRQALEEHPATKNPDLPFWNQQAIEWLNSKANDPQAKQYLKELGTDFPNLIQEVEENSQESYNQYVQLFAHLNNGVMPNAEGKFSLRDAVIWTVDHYCVDGKPLAGILVLLDEFSQFIEGYSQSKALGDLQDLLQGIGDRKGNAMFLAFAQHDPDEVADRVGGGQVLQNIKRELSRIDRKYALYSLMESVLSASLNPSEAAWQEFLQDNPACRGFIYGQAAELVWDLYQKRYANELGWTNEKFRNVVVKGCFPLHPLTTALLCHLQMQQGIDDDARTILKFVRGQVEAKLEEPVSIDGRVNWILPIQLADYFGKRIADPKLYSAYENAIDNLEQVFGDKVTQVHYDILKALLLQNADNLNTTDSKQVDLLAQMSGYDFQTTLSTLKELSKNSIIHFDKNTRYNGFWPSAINPQALEQKIRNLVGDKKFGADELYSLNSDLPTIFPDAVRVSVSVPWGTSNDWAANTTIITKEKLTPESLQDVVKPFRISYSGFQDGSRGLVGWLYAMDEGNVEFFKEKAAQVLKDAFPSETPPPVLLVLPTLPNKNLGDLYLRYQALGIIRKDTDAIKEIGQAAFDNEFERTTAALRKALGDLFGDLEKFASISRESKTLTVPAPYKASLPGLHQLTIDEILKKIYELAYPYRPPEFFTELPANPKKGLSQLRDAVRTVSKNLLSNQISTASAGMTPMARDRVCKQQLMQKWHLLSTTYWIQEPEILSLKRAWDYLEEQIKPDDKEISVISFIPNLLNPPFGFDYNTATLLLTAWIGKHNKELRFYAKGKVVGLEYIEGVLDQKTPQEFLWRLCVDENLAIERRDADKALVDGRELVDSIQRGEPRSQSDAEIAISKLVEIVTSDICPEDEKAEFYQAVTDLTDALNAAMQYDVSAKKMLASIENEDSVRRLLDFRSNVKKLSIPVLVLAAEPPISEIQEKLDAKIKNAVENTSSLATELDRLEGADAVRNILHEQKGLLNREGFLELVTLLAEAEYKLDARIQELRSKAEAAATQKQIAAMTSKAELATLREYLAELEIMQLESEDMISLRASKLDEIQRAITELETFAVTSLETYPEVNPSDAQQLYETMLRTISRYTETEYEGSLNQATAYLKQFISYCSELRSVTDLPLRNLEDSIRVPSRIGEIKSQYGEVIVSNTHIAILEKVQQEIEDRIQNEYEKTEKRVEELEMEIDTIPVSKAFEKLAGISVFISPDVQVRIENLKTKLAEMERQERIIKIEKEAQDVIERIEQLFLSIADPQKQQECLERLHKKVVLTK